MAFTFVDPRPVPEAVPEEPTPLVSTWNTPSTSCMIFKYNAVPGAGVSHSIVAPAIVATIY